MWAAQIHILTLLIGKITVMGRCYLQANSYRIMLKIYQNIRTISLKWGSNTMPNKTCLMNRYMTP